MSMKKVKYLFWMVVLSSFFIGVDIDFVELVKLVKLEALLSILLFSGPLLLAWRLPDIIKAFKR